MLTVVCAWLVPVTTTSPGCTPVMISVPSEVESPTTTGFVVALPFTMICTVGLSPEPPTADVGTITTLVRLVTAMLAVPVIPASVPFGQTPERIVTVYWTGDELPACVLVLPELCAWTGSEATTPAAVWPVSASKLSCTVWPTCTFVKSL